MKDLSEYKAEDIVLMVSSKDSYDLKDYKVITGFGEEPYTSPRMWHTAKQMGNGNWLVSILHKNNRVINIELTDDSYKEYGFAELKPRIISPFNVNYNDEDLKWVIK